LRSSTALGLLLPGILDIAAVLTAVGAIGVAVLMLGAAATHLRRGEQQMLPLNAALLAIAVFIAIERFGPHAF
jgi:DoxX-like family